MTVRKSAIFTTAAVLAAVVLFLTRPPAPQSTSSPVPDRPDTITRRGAFHVHTTRSDGALDKRQVAAAASRAGLSFVVFTDHGDGTRTPDPPEIIDGVLCIDGVEISTNGGHYVAIGMPQSPYPLGGEAATVVEDVARLGGFGVVAHPDSPRDELAWKDWNAPVDGVEWLNADSEWRDETRARLSRSFLDYLWRPAGALASLLDRPVGAMAKWDQLTERRPVVGIAGHDAHGGFGAEANGGDGRRWRIPSYESSFRTFAIYVTTDKPAAGADAQTEADGLMAAIRRGEIFTAIEAVAAPASLDFRASIDSRIVRAGGSLPLSQTPARFTIRAAIPGGGRLVLVRNGEVVAESSGGTLEHESSEPGTYRSEVHAARAPGAPPVPWLVSNPIYRLPPQPIAAIDSAVVAPILDPPVTSLDWHVERSDGSLAEFRRRSPSGGAEGSAVDFNYQLAGHRRSTFAALAADLSSLPDDADAIVIRARASRPSRVSVQLRFGNDGNVRWVRSVYLEPADREIRIPMEGFKPAEPGGPRPPLSRVSSLLFVVDLVNAAPGAIGTVTLTRVAFGKSGAASAPDQVRTVK